MDFLFELIGREDIQFVALCVAIMAASVLGLIWSHHHYLGRDDG